MQNRAPAAFTWHYLATQDANEGRYREAQSKFRMALFIQQELGDLAEEANTFANLAAIAVEIGRGEMALRLYIISVLLMREVRHPNLEAVEQAANELASRLGYTEYDFGDIINEVIDDYYTDGGWDLIEDTFSDAFWENME